MKKRLAGRKYTNRLAWAVWKIAQNNKRRAAEGIAKVCRWFSNFNGVDSYAQFTDEIVLTGNFEIEISVDGAASQMDKKVISLDNGSNVFNIGTDDLASGKLRIFTGAGFATHRTINDVFNDSLNIVRFSYNNLTSNIDIYINDTFDSTMTSTSYDFSLSNMITLGNQNPRNDFFIGQISNIKITDGTTQIVNMPLDERYIDIHGEIIYNNLASMDLWYLDFMGGHLTAQRVWNPDAVNNGFGIQAYFDASIDGTIISQNISAGLASRELQVFTQSDTFICVMGGVLNTIGNSTGVGLYRIDFDGVTLSLYKDDVFVDSVISTLGVSREPTADFMVAARGNGAGLYGYLFNGRISPLTFWTGGTSQTGTKVLDYDFQSLSNVIPNSASTTSANLWDGSMAVATGESSVIDSNTVRVLSTAGAFTEVVVAGVGIAGVDYLVTVELISGSLDNVIAGQTSVEFTGWRSMRDANKQPIPNKFTTLVNSPSTTNLVLKRDGICDATLINIEWKTVTGYGVLSGVRNADWTYSNDSPNAIGFNITTTQDPECAPDEQNNVTWNGDNVTWNGDEVTYN